MQLLNASASMKPIRQTSYSIRFTLPALYLISQGQMTTLLRCFRSPNPHMSNPCQNGYLFSALNTPQMPAELWLSAVKTRCYSGLFKLTKGNRCLLKNTRKILLTLPINWQFKVPLFSISISTALILISDYLLEIFFLRNQSEGSA